MALVFGIPGRLVVERLPFGVGTVIRRRLGGWADRGMFGFFGFWADKIMVGGVGFSGGGWW